MGGVQTNRDNWVKRPKISFKMCQFKSQHLTIASHLKSVVVPTIMFVFLTSYPSRRRWLMRTRKKMSRSLVRTISTGRKTVLMWSKSSNSRVKSRDSDRS